MTDYAKNLRRNCLFQRAKGTDRENDYPEGEHTRDCDICQGANEIERLTKDNEDLQYANDFCGRTIGALTVANERLAGELSDAKEELCDANSEAIQAIDDLDSKNKRLTADVLHLKEKAIFWKRRADQRQIDINELKKELKPATSTEDGK